MLCKGVFLLFSNGYIVCLKKAWCKKNKWSKISFNQLSVGVHIFVFKSFLDFILELPSISSSPAGFFEEEKFWKEGKAAFIKD